MLMKVDKPQPRLLKAQVNAAIRLADLKWGPARSLESALAMFGCDGEQVEWDTPLQWVALTARPSREIEAADWLKRTRLFAYWPNKVTQIRMGSGAAGMPSRRRAVYRAIIPGYIFAAQRLGNTAHPCNLIGQVPGLIGFVRGFDGGPALLRQRDIEIIRHIEARENMPPPAPSEVSKKFKFGDKVRFIDDIYSEWPPGVVKQLYSDDRIAIDVPLLGRVVPMEVSPSQIEPM
jgi:transcription antitermination factor NusG